MKNIYKIFIFLPLLLAACTDLSDEVFSDIPADQYPENLRQAEAVTAPAYTKLQGHMDGGWWFAQEITGDLVTAPTRSEDWDDGGKWRQLHQHTWDPNTEAVRTMWENLYNGVTECNRAIDYLGDTEAAQTAVAQMKVLRAYYYFAIIDNYGNVPYVTSFFEAPEMPEKTRREEIYQNLISDIKLSIPYLSSSTSKSAVGTYAAYALLAKLYLNAEVYTGTADWDNAMMYTDSVLAGPYSLESNRLAPFKTENENSSENIFTIPFDEDNYQGFILHRRTLHYNNDLTFNAKSSFWNGFAAQEILVDLFESNDTRLGGLLIGPQYSYLGDPIKDPGAADADVVFTKNIPALDMDASYSREEIRFSGARMVKFEIKMGVKDNLSNDFPIFRLADFKLMKAELLMRTGGDVGQALGLVNEIRSAAGASAWDAADLTFDNLLEERGRELWYEGHRRQDMIRFGKFNEAWWEKDADSEINNIFPIPQNAVDANPNLKEAL